jgi:GAF domain-containing protein
MTTPRDARLARHFVTLADTLVDDFDLAELLDQLVHSCVDVLDGSAAGLLLTDRHGALHPIASSTEQTRLLELFQLQNDEGPCLDCLHTGLAISVPDVSVANERWPRFGPAAVQSGFRSVYGLPMRLRKDTIGSLNLFLADRTPLEDSELHVAQALADVATIGILQQQALQRASQLAEQLQGALTSRIVIEQAKGVLAEHGGVDLEQAFAALRAYARNNNVKLSDAAEDLVHGTTPPDSMIEPRGR